MKISMSSDLPNKGSVSNRDCCGIVNAMLSFVH